MRYGWAAALSCAVVFNSAALAAPEKPAEQPRVMGVSGGWCFLKLTNSLPGKLHKGVLYSSAPDAFPSEDFPDQDDGVLPLFESLDPGAVMEAWVPVSPDGELEFIAVTKDITPLRKSDISCPADGAVAEIAVTEADLNSGPLVVQNETGTVLASAKFKTDPGSAWGPNLLPAPGLADSDVAVFLTDEVGAAGWALLEDDLGRTWVWPYSMDTTLGAAVVAHPSLANDGPPCELVLQNNAPVPVDFLRVEGSFPLPLPLAWPSSAGAAPGGQTSTLVPPGDWAVIWYAKDDPKKHGKLFAGTCVPGGNITAVLDPEQK